MYTSLAGDLADLPKRQVSRVLQILSYREFTFVSNLLDAWAQLEGQHELWTLIRTCLIIPSRFKDERLLLVAKFLDSHPRLCEIALADSLLENDINPQQAWEFLKESVQQSVDKVLSIVRLASLIEGYNPEYSWKMLEQWADSEFEMRFAAAHIISHWKINFPERAQVIAAKLAADPNDEIATVATMNPTEPISPNILEDFIEENLIVKEELSDAIQNYQFAEDIWR